MGAVKVAQRTHKPSRLTSSRGGAIRGGLPGGATASALDLALAAAQTADDNHARDIVILDLRKLTPIFDYFVIATGTSRRQLHAISEDIDDKLQEELGDFRLGIEGYQESRWIVLDYGNVVVHLFDEEARKYYALDDLWAQAERVPFEPASGRNGDGNGTPRPR